TINVLVVDDSPTVREALVVMLQTAPDFNVVGQARDGQEAALLAARLRPDVITMDIRMPRVDGLEATRRIMSTVPTPIVVVANHIYESDLNIAFNAIAAGALTVVEKPQGLIMSDFTAVRDQLVNTVRLMSDVPVIHHWHKKVQDQMPVAAPVTTPVVAIERPPQRLEIVGIASSTGGPGALATILRSLPEDFTLPIVIVQHITKGFVTGLANWLSHETSLTVSVAQQGMPLEAGSIVLAPDDYHIQINRQGIIQLSSDAPYRGLRPSANYLFQSLAQAYGPHAVGLILTGMGDDGVDGLAELHAAGGTTIAQDEDSCIVYGMPREAVARQAIDHVLALEQVAPTLSRWVAS
ncbi:MAG TPA: chemotaxis-specific protein-glutamate methyltransferase CheB, partial [Anaerolineae bacterium]|nr:chemotaxis-specific protein-glutamate methyltransferase CheB [Anaerolineae bacterium]